MICRSESRQDFRTLTTLEVPGIRTEEKLKEVLTLPQLERLKQIKVQIALTPGATSLLKGELAEEIALSDKQKTHLSLCVTKGIGFLGE